MPACPLDEEELADEETEVDAEDPADEDAVTTPLCVGVACGNPTGDGAVLARAEFVVTANT